MIKERTHEEIRKEDDAYGTGTTPTPSNPKQPNDNWAIVIIVAAVALIVAAVILM